MFKIIYSEDKIQPDFTQNQKYALERATIVQRQLTRLGIDQNRLAIELPESNLQRGRYTIYFKLNN